jgi:N-acetylmuramoyl-L-alanine amidase
MIKKSFTQIIVAIVFLSSATAQRTIKIVDKPVVFDEERKKLSLEYLENRYHIHQLTPYIVPQMIVLHWTAIPTLQQSFDAMNPAVLPGSRKEIASSSSLNVASQFLIDRDGTIYRQLPDTAFARHVIGLNYCAIGVENVGSDKALLTKEQLQANEDLIRYLVGKYPIKYLIGHYEYKKFIGDPLWKEVDPDYLTSKTDPDVDFMKAIRLKVKDLGLKGPPTSGK